MTSVSALPPAPEESDAITGSELPGEWIEQRIPAAESVTLGLRTIFILPTREGMFYALMLLFLMVAAINYQNSLIFAVTFLLGSLFVVSIFHTWRNLSGLTFIAGSARAAFAGENAEFTVTVRRPNERRHEAVQMGWRESIPASADLVDSDETKVRLYVPAANRGRLTPGRMLVQTYYPVGLFRAWSWVDLKLSAIIYPRPIRGGAIPRAQGDNDEGELLDREGVDDFVGLREYQEGDGLRHIAWKSYARTQEMFTKRFAAYVDHRVWLDWDQFPGLDREGRLSRLAWWVVRLSGGPDEYGLRLPGVEVEPARGEAHREKVLTALALFEIE